MSDARSIAYEDYRKNTADHSLEIRQDSGEYRHLSFSRNGSNIYRFDLITWPGYLTICGDMGTYTFTRLRDMFSFFRDEVQSDVPKINPSYWAEKLVSVDKNAPIKEFSIKRFTEALRSEIEGQGFEGEEFDSVWAMVRAEILDDLDGYSELQYFSKAVSFQYEDDSDYIFSEIYEYDCTEFTFHYLWALYAIVDGIRQYDEAVAAIEKEHEERVRECYLGDGLSNPIKDIDNLFAIQGLEDAGLVVEGKDEFLKLLEKGGALFEPLQQMMREGRKHGVSISPRSQSFHDHRKARDAFMESFRLSAEKAEKVMENLNWVNTHRFENGELPNGFGNHLVVLNENQIVVTEHDDLVITLSECPTTLEWSYTLIPQRLIRKNNGHGKFEEPYGYYAKGMPFEISSFTQAGFASKEEALADAFGELERRVKENEEMEEF